MMKHANVSVFVPHVGCPCQCSFCNQHSITGVAKEPTPQDVRLQLEQSGVIGTDWAKNTQLAFFGGSFTAIDRGYMLSLLQEAKSCVLDYGLDGVRISTRPDAIDAEILELLKAHCVTAIELGAQSMNDEVLRANNRGHSAEDVRKAASLIKESGFELGLQMMTGLYTDTDERALQTAREIIALSPDTVRIYPTVVLRGTRLDELMKAGEYEPQGVEEAVELCARLIPMFEESGIRVIRVGLHAEESLEAERVGGAYHPAFRELCESRIFLTRLLCVLDELHEKCYNIRVNPKTLSVAIGQRKRNAIALKEMGYDIRFVPDESIRLGSFELEAGQSTEQSLK